MDCTDDEVSDLINSTSFPKLLNSRILKAATGEIPDKLPIWIMRQAGRYLPEFKELRKKHSFFEICQTPKFACEATLMPIRRYALDAAIIFSDILVIPQSLGMEVVMEPEKGPVFPNPLTIETVNQLTWDGAVGRLDYVGKAIRLTRHKLEGKVPLLGFSAAPWTLLVYMIEGGGTKTASKAKKWVYAHRNLIEHLVKNLTNVIIDYLVMQIEYGAQMVQLFESSAEYLNAIEYQAIFGECIKKIRTGILDKLAEKKIAPVPISFFAKGGSHLLEIILDAGYEVIGMDWITEPSKVRALSKNITLQGNLDPCVLYCNKDDLTERVKKMIDSYGFNRYIVNLGHGIYPDAPVDAVQWFIEAVHSYKP